MERRYRQWWLALAAVCTLGGCAGIPDGAVAVRDFEVERYLGTWYEIARLDHSFERGLSRVTATYGARDDGGISVLNRGYEAATGRWRQAEGRAYPVGETGEGRLKVSFFRPFYGGYNIIALAPDYHHAMVCGPSTAYLWILARTPTLDEATTATLVAQARNLGFDTDALIFVVHDDPPADGTPD